MNDLPHQKNFWVFSNFISQREILTSALGVHCSHPNMKDHVNYLNINSLNLLFKITMCFLDMIKWTNNP